jgi:tetratricopeptide (TPR) repeat protein
MTYMMGKFSIIAVLAGLALSPGASIAQSDLWKLFTDRGVDAYTRGDFASAAKLLDQALAEARAHGPAGPGNLSVAISLENLAALHDDAGAHEKAAPLYRRAVTAWEAVIGARDVQFATKLNLVAVYFERRGKYDEAAGLFARALDITEGYLGPNHSIVAGVLSKLAGVRRKAGIYPSAEKLYLRAIAIRERAAGIKSPRLIRILQGYAELLRATARDEEAARVDARVASIRN